MKVDTMAYHSRSELPNYKLPQHSRDPQDFRVLLAEYILNFEFPRDVYVILITVFTIYLALKVFRMSLSILHSVIRPLIFIVAILIALPYLYEMKFGTTSNRMMSNMYSQTGGFIQNVGRMMNSIYSHTIQFYAKHF